MNAEELFDWKDVRRGSEKHDMASYVWGSEY